MEHWNDEEKAELSHIAKLWVAADSPEGCAASSTCRHGTQQMQPGPLQWCLVPGQEATWTN